MEDNYAHIRRLGPPSFHALDLLLDAIHSFLSFVFGLSGKKFRLPHVN